jgi:predicted DNA-binding protein (UPF0251 family)
MNAARQAMFRFMEEDVDLVRVPRSTRQLARKAYRMAEEERLSLRDAAASVGLTVETVLAARDAERIAASGDPRDWETATDSDVFACHEARPLVPEYERNLSAEASVARVMAALDPCHAEILRLAFLDGEQRSIAALAVALGVSRATAARRLTAALEAARSLPAISALTPAVSGSDEEVDLASVAS